jgi:hypothetical protein
MPRATVTQETVRRELRSCPEGYVELRTLSFHEMNSRSDIAARVYQEEQVPKKGQKRERPDTIRGYFEIMNVATTEYEFRNCIVDHNLEDENGQTIDFTRPMQSWRLDPKIGAEIGQYINELNQFDLEAEEEVLVPLAMSASSSSPIETSLPNLSTEEN